ncbi:MAG: hypothetical protein LN408_06160, partial [Candidatus Thermoplasmatota archaeon]|nr:hypothetical protein [Candidatus Thermoplasmatota archaeon]
MLDDLEFISKIDKSNQIKTIEKFPFQINEAIEIVDKLQIDKIFKINNIIFNGMGGSAISGDIIQTLFINRLNIPIYVNRSYNLPTTTSFLSLRMDALLSRATLAESTRLYLSKSKYTIMKSDSLTGIT